MPSPGRPPGMPKTGGRKKGVPNKINSVARTAFLAVFENLRPDLEGWIRETARGVEKPVMHNGEPLIDASGKPVVVRDAPNPGKAAELTIRLAEYHFPKAPTEITGKDGAPLTLDFRIDLAKANDE